MIPAIDLNRKMSDKEQDAQDDYHQHRNQSPFFIRVFLIYNLIADQIVKSYTAGDSYKFKGLLPNTRKHMEKKT